MLKFSRCDIMLLQTTIMNTRFGSSKETEFSKEHCFLPVYNRVCAGGGELANRGSWIYATAQSEIVARSQGNLF